MSEYKENNIDTENAEMIADGADTSGVIDIAKGKKNTKAGGADGNTGVYVHKFKKPFEYEGTKYTTMNFYFERLTGRDMIAIENEMQGLGEYIIDPLLSRSFQSKMAGRAGNVGTDVLEALPLQEFNRIVNAGRNFLTEGSGA